MKETEFRELIERIRQQTDIVAVIGQRIFLDRHNKALCPFHNEKTPSFSVNPGGQYFRCFGCGTGGDVFKFLQLYEHKSFMAILTDLAQQTGIRLPDLTDEDRNRIKETNLIEDILSKTAQFYQRSLTPKVKDYLIEERAFTEETISRFQIGYANGGLREYLVDKRKLSIDLCLKAGVLRKSDGGAIRDYFYGRIIFPNLKRGRVVHLSGRSLDGQEPKYLHLPGEM